MFLISVLVGRAQPVVWALMFRAEDKAHAALTKLQDVGNVDVEDDFGQRLVAKGGDLGPILFENMEASRSAMVERTVNEQRVRAMAVSRMQSDPTFKTAMMAAAPPLLSPIGMNGRG